MIRYTISILTYSAVEQAKRCIASVLNGGGNFKLVLTANGNPEAAKLFQSVAETFADTVVIINDTNEGFINPTIKAFDHCDTEFFVCLNDDAIVPKGWLEKLREPFDTDPKMAITGPEGGCCGFNSNFQGIPSRNVEYVEFACAMLRADLVRQHGLFDPELSHSYFEDVHQSFRMRELGYHLKLAPFRIAHERGATSKKIPQIRWYQAQNGQFMRKRWAPYIKTKRFDYVTFIKRDAAWGDVLLTTPIIRALKERNPQSPIWVQTKCAAIFDRNPHVAEVGPQLVPPQNAWVIDLNGAYEDRPETHVIEAYSSIAGVKSGCHTELFCTDEDRYNAAMMLRDYDDWTAIHVGPTTWKGKNWPMDRWAELIRQIPGKTVLVGHAMTARLPVTLDLRGKTTLHELAAVLQRCRMLVTVDSLPLHVAQAMKTPVVGLFGVTSPNFLVTDGSECRSVCADASIPSTGSRHRVAGRTMVDDPYNCMDSISVDAVLSQVTSLLNDETRGQCLSSLS